MKFLLKVINLLKERSWPTDHFRSKSSVTGNFYTDMETGRARDYLNVALLALAIKVNRCNRCNSTDLSLFFFFFFLNHAFCFEHGNFCSTKLASSKKEFRKNLYLYCAETSRHCLHSEFYSSGNAKFIRAMPRYQFDIKLIFI